MSALDTTKLAAFPGRPGTLGARAEECGVHFAIFSRHATRVWLVLFHEDGRIATEYELTPEHYRRGDIWSIFVAGLQAGARYLYRMDGPNDPSLGFFYDPGNSLLDPCAKAIVGDIDRGEAKCLVVSGGFDWGDDQSPRIPAGESILYEVHVKGFSAHPSAGAAHPGTYSAFMEKIPHLQAMGVTAVEFLPLQHCGERVIAARTNPETGQHLTNYWGYQPIAHFAPDGWYAADGGQGGQLDEFRRLVAALHAVGIEVIVDVVFNHTAEHTELEPTLGFRGIDNQVYYHVREDGTNNDMTGCGNTFNCNHPVVSDFIIDCLRYWAVELHVDGFRFDLACVLNRDRHGALHREAPLIERIAEDPILREVKLIAEPWDLAGGYQLGSFGGPRWAEWNGRFRDDVRRFWRGDLHTKGDFARRLTGSPDLFQDDGRPPQASINFISAHDGFTLRDLVSFNEKHNHANGEENRDGFGENLSWNAGAEGETDDPAILALRLTLQKSYLASLFFSLGVPMLLGGDEFGRTQQGNNNAYCQDNALTWFDWALAEKNAGLLRFCQAAIALRKQYPVFRRTSFFTGRPVHEGEKPDILWFDARGQGQVWDSEDLSLACRIDGSQNAGASLYLIFNPSVAATDFTLPKGRWRLRLDSGAATPDNNPGPATAVMIENGGPLRVLPKALALLEEEGGGGVSAAGELSLERD